MNTTEITESQVTEWMLSRLAELIAIAPIGATSINVQADDFDKPVGPRVRFIAYNDKTGHGRNLESLDLSMASFRKLAGAYTRTEKARQNREQAAALIAEADALESATL